MHHFLFEFITGGGLSGQLLPESLAHEGELMLEALLLDLIRAGHTNISLTRDAGLKPLDNCVTQHIVDADIKGRLSKIVKKGDVVWLIAPETDDCLASYADFFINQGCLLIASSVDSIRLTSSKMLTFQHLKEANIETIETCYLYDPIPASDHGWIIKPDDGAGAENCYFFYDIDELNEFISGNNKNNYLIQPFIPGKHMSMSFIAYQGKARLLACNQQYIEIENEKLKLIAVGINECLDCLKPLSELADHIAHSIPGLAGYVGVDLIMHDKRFSIVEINPRFTTAYVGLSTSLGINVADTIFNVFQSKYLPEIDISSASPMRIDV